MVLRQGGDPALGETFRSPSKFTRGLNPTPSFSPKAETLAMPYGVIVVAEKSGGKVQGW